MQQSSLTPAERARRIETTIRAALKSGETQDAIAAATNLSPATVTRLLNDHLPGFAAVLAQLGLKVVPAAYECLDPEAYAFVTSRLELVMKVQPKLIWNAE